MKLKQQIDPEQEFFIDLKKVGSPAGKGVRKENNSRSVSKNRKETINTIRTNDQILDTPHTLKVQ